MSSQRKTVECCPVLPKEKPQVIMNITVLLKRDSTISLQYCVLFMAGRKTKKGYLDWEKEDLQRAVESSRNLYL